MTQESRSTDICASRATHDAGGGNPVLFVEGAHGRRARLGVRSSALPLVVVVLPPALAERITGRSRVPPAERRVVVRVLDKVVLALGAAEREVATARVVLDRVAVVDTRCPRLDL